MLTIAVNKIRIDKTPNSIQSIFINKKGLILPFDKFTSYT